MLRSIAVCVLFLELLVIASAQFQILELALSIKGREGNSTLHAFETELKWKQAEAYEISSALSAR